MSENQLPLSDLPKVIDDVYRSLSGLGAPQATAKRSDPAVPIKRSVMPDQYRVRWSLARDYPMVAPNYARQRSRLAKEIDFGTGKRCGRG